MFASRSSAPTLRQSQSRDRRVDSMSFLLVRGLGRLAVVLLGPPLRGSAWRGSRILLVVRVSRHFAFCYQKRRVVVLDSEGAEESILLTL
jgi:hypothetical protein